MPLELIPIEDIIYERLMEGLTPKIKEWIKSLFLDSRITQDLNPQIFRRPKGIQPIIDTWDLHKDDIEKVLKRKFPEKFSRIVDISKTKDSLERISLWITAIQE